MNPRGRYFPITKQFDTFSNTLYWLVTNGKFSTSGTSSMIINDDNPRDVAASRAEISALGQSSLMLKSAHSLLTITPCTPLPIPSEKDLLLNSRLRNQGLIEVPLIYIKVCYDSSETNIRKAYFQVIDNIYHYLPAPFPKCSKCLVQGACPKNIVFTKLSSKLNITSVVIGSGKTIYDKANNIGGSVIAIFLILYAESKLILARMMYGNFSLEYLTRDFNDKFFRDLERSRFCHFIRAFANEDYNILDYDQYFVQTL